MAGRPKMDESLVAINDKITRMAEMVKEDIITAIDSIKEKNGQVAREIIDSGDEIDDMEDEINEECFAFLATQAPVASDLRYCISVMKMIRDLERIGDHCEDLAKFTLRLDQYEYSQELIDIPRMAEMSAEMVSNSIRAFLDRDLRLARKVWKADEEVDELFRVIYNEQLEMAKTNGDKAQVYIMFAFIAAHLERIADYATNICEEVVFFLEGCYLME